MGFLEKIYDKSPIFFQNIMVSVSGYQKNQTRYGKTYYEYLEFLKEFDNLNLEEKLKFQEKELIEFIKYTNDNSEFYKKIYKDIDISSINNIEDLKKLPIVDKEMIRINSDEISTVSKRNAVENHTGGTTGKPLVSLMTPKDMMKRMAMLDHFKFRVGFEHLSMKRATFNGQHIIPPNQKKKIFWRYNKACKQMIYSSFHIIEENMKYYVDSLNHFKPQAIDGFFMSICDIAGYIERHNIQMKFKLIAIFPTSETLTQSGRELLERVFGCKVYDQYASAEGAPFVTECPNQRLHVELASGVFEQVEKYNDEILVTSFTTHGTPLIRYRIGDSMDMEKSSFVCECGMQTPIVKKIQGRSLDFLYTAGGAKIYHVGGVARNIPHAIVKTQLIQDEIGKITVKVEVDKELYKEEYDEILINEYMNKFGIETKIVLEHVDDIPREKSGKFKMIKNNIGINGNNS